MHLRSVIRSALCVLLAATAPLTRADPPVARATRSPEPMTIDGVLDEAAWDLAEPITSFTQRLPAEGEPATQRTEVRVLYDDERLFIGAVLHDDDAGRIVAREMKEDGDLNLDDSFGVLLDTFRDRRNGFFFETNPNGARADAIFYDEGRTTSFDWDGVWTTASRITDDGWVVEMEIPFRTLYFDPGKTNIWGLQFRRLIRRNAEDAYWSPLPRNESLWRISRAGELHGLEGIQQGGRLTVKPYALGAARRRPSFDEGALDGTGDVGVDARYHLTPNLVAVLTVNTDFAETEVDNQQVNITRFPLFFPEKREFFLESTGYFDFGYTPIGATEIIPFFSRRVGLTSDGNEPVPLIGGAKLVGRMGRYNLGFLSTNTDNQPGAPQTNFSALRISRDIFTRSNWGFIGINREPAGPDTADPLDPGNPLSGNHTNRTWGGDVNFSVLRNLKFGASRLQTYTPGVTEGQGATQTYVEWSNDAWVMNASYKDIGEAFNPESGFVRRTGIEEGLIFTGWTWRSATAPVRRIEPHGRVVYIMDQDHDLATRRQHWGTTVEFRDGSEIEVAWDPGFDALTETFVLDEDSGAEVRPGAYDTREIFVRYDGDGSRVMSASAFVEWGDFFDGDIRTIDILGRARISRYLRTSLGVRRTEIDLPSRPVDAFGPALPSTDFDFTLVQGRVGVTFSTRIFFDALLQYNTDLDDFSSNLRFNFKYRPGSDIYVVYNERRDIEGAPTDVVDRTFTVKWTYQFAL